MFVFRGYVHENAHTEAASFTGLVVVLAAVAAAVSLGARLGAAEHLTAAVVEASERRVLAERRVAAGRRHVTKCHLNTHTSHTSSIISMALSSQYQNLNLHVHVREHVF